MEMDDVKLRIIFILWMFMVCIVSGAFTSTVAAQKGYDRIAWFIGGFFFSLIALLAAIGLPDKVLRSKFTNEKV